MYLFLSFLNYLPFVGIIVTEVPRKEAFQYRLDQTLFAVPTLSTIKEPLILISSQVVTLMTVLDSSGTKVISATGRFVALCYFSQVSPVFINSYFYKGLLSVSGLIQ